MEDNFRNVLIILSAIVIGAIFVHGLWTIRKQKNPYKLNASKNKVEPLSRDFDGRGFDQDGVGQVKVKVADKKAAPSSDVEEMLAEEDAKVAKTAEIKSSEQANSAPEMNESINTEQLSDVALAAALVADSTAPQAELADNYQSAISALTLDGELSPLGDELVDSDNAEQDNSLKEPIVELVAPPVHKPLYKQPVSRPKPPQAKSTTQANSNQTKVSQAKREQIKRNQMEINFGEIPNIVDETMPSIHAEAKPSAVAQSVQGKFSTSERTNVAPESQVIIISVVMPANLYMSGASLLPSLLTLGMKYGEMNIFHRHQDNAGNGPVTFSLANMMNPGAFDLDSMETFATQGVSLFMTLPNKGDPFAVFEQMLAAAKQLAQEFNAQVLDDKRNILTKQTEQHYVSQIREFDRKSRLAAI